MFPYHRDGGTLVYVLKRHLDTFHTQEQAISKALAPTARDVINKACVPLVIGEECCYRWRERKVMLTPEVAAGSDWRAIAIAKHELGHTRQPRWMWPFRLFTPVRWWMEMDAWHRAIGPA